MSPIRALWLRLQGSLWFVPTVITVGCIALAMVLIEAHGWVEIELAGRWPRLFGAGVDGTRSMLSAIATSMVTVAGVVFSVTIVALSLASSQYSPRVLRNFMSDRPTQAVLGAFVGIYAYCLVVLRTVRDGEEGPDFVPSLAALGGVALALLGVAMLIFFIHHVAISIQAAAILERIAGDTAQAIDRLFPQSLGRPLQPGAPLPATLPACWHDVPARATGYLVSVDDDGLMRFAVQHGCVLRLLPAVGDFVIEGRPLVQVARAQPPDAARAAALCRLFTLARQRTVHQDASYGVQQIVDVALKALSPGINDPTTAVMCIDRLGALLVRLAGRRIPGPLRSDDAQALRVIARGPDFEDLLALALDAIACHARGDAAVLARLLHTLAVLEEVVQDPQRRRALQRRLSLLVQALDAVALPARGEPLRTQADGLARRLQA